MRTHIAILKQPYISMILEGIKTIECRLTRIACPPFRTIEPGDLLYLKRSGGTIQAKAIAEKVQFFENISASDIRRLQQHYNHLIRADHDYWQQRHNCRFCTLIWLTEVAHIKPLPFPGKGMRAWHVFEQPPEAIGLPVSASR